MNERFTPGAAAALRRLLKEIRSEQVLTDLFILRLRQNLDTLPDFTGAINELWLLLLLREILNEQVHINDLLKRLLHHLHGKPKLTTLTLTFSQGARMADQQVLQVGQKTTATVSGLDQYGKPFPIDFGANPAAWSIADSAAVSGTVSSDTSSDELTGNEVTSGDTLTVTCAGLSVSAVLVVQQAPAKLTSLQVDFSSPA